MTVPTCATHGIAKVQVNDRSRSTGKRWVCRPCVNERSLAWQKKNPAKRRKAWRESSWKKQGIDPNFTHDDFLALLGDQGGKCLICETTEPGGKDWHVDHDHDTGRVRCTLCWKCNRGLGLFLDDHALMSRAANYLILTDATPYPWEMRF